MTALERLVGPPMAAPETAFMRRLRFVFIGFAGASALGIVGIDLIVALCGRVAAGGALLATIAVACVSGTIFFYRKIRVDNRWIRARGFDRDGKGV